MKKLFFTLLLVTVASAMFAQSNARVRSEDTNNPEIDNLSGLKPDETDLIPSAGVANFSTDNTATGTTGTSDDSYNTKGITNENMMNGKNTESLESTVVYPNPAKEFITVSADVESGTIRILNLLGQEMGVYNINSNLTSIDVSNYGEGIYFVSIESGVLKITKKIKILY